MINLFNIIGSNCNRLLYYNCNGKAIECTVNRLRLHSSGFISEIDGDTVNISKVPDCFVEMSLKYDCSANGMVAQFKTGVDYFKFQRSSDDLYLYSNPVDCRHKNVQNAVLYLDRSTMSLYGLRGEEIYIRISRDITETLDCSWQDTFKFNSFRDFISLLRGNRKRCLRTFAWNYLYESPVEERLTYGFIYDIHGNDKKIYDLDECFINGIGRKTHHHSENVCYGYVHAHKQDEIWYNKLTPEQHLKYDKMYSEYKD